MKNPPRFDLSAVPGGFMAKLPDPDMSLDVLAGYDLEIDATRFVLVDPTDRTKQYRFDLSNLATGQFQTFGGYNRALVHVAADGTTLTAARSNRLILLDTTTVDYTLPVIVSGTDDGLTFNFYCESASTGASGQSLIAQGTNFLAGAVTVETDSVPTSDVFQANGSSHLTMALNATTTGGAVPGSFFTARARTGKWWLSGVLLGTGATVTTPFS